MAAGVTLASLRDQLRAEIGASANPAMGQNAVHQMNHILNRTQERLWADFDWPQLVIDRDVPMVDGQRFYSLGNDIDFNRVFSTDVKYSATWRPVSFGISTANYNELDPEENDKQDPVMAWDTSEDGNIEVWPTPASTGTTKMRFRAIKKLQKMSADADVSMLDDKLIVLFSAADMLAHAKAPDAGVKLQLANAHYARLRGHSNKNNVTIYGGGRPAASRGMVGGRVYPTGNYGLPGS